MSTPESTPEKRPPPVIQTSFFVKAENGGAGAKRPAALVQTSGTDSRQLLLRLGIAVVLAGAIFLTWWSLTQVLGPRQQESRELSTRVSQLSAQVEDMDRKWPKVEAVVVNERFGQLHAELFGGKAGLDAWVAGLKEQVEPLGLGLQAEFGAPTPLATNGQRVLA